MKRWRSLNSMKMEAIRILVEQGDKPKSKKKSKNTPVPNEEVEVHVA